MRQNPLLFRILGLALIRAECGFILFWVWFGVRDDQGQRTPERKRICDNSGPRSSSVLQGPLVAYRNTSLCWNRQRHRHWVSIGPTSGKFAKNGAPYHRTLCARSEVLIRSVLLLLVFKPCPPVPKLHCHFPTQHWRDIIV
ncbi:uncharacterized protein EI90DRAFT_3052612 [Cantharellus anzutake]|uniref:uncharacterized protein n=1 Tax=Cantharellus anzutake TaxID=1750568 RepID=UPI0019088A62|nr:uncharacterized protein EI90DRAFT_3052612 [Cantharellus anzutake]KAF8333628.1 hypothetical protein EI90DRAFT_3052612 [Cantharellus anzutake]